MEKLAIASAQQVSDILLEASLRFPKAIQPDNGPNPFDTESNYIPTILDNNNGPHNNSTNNMEALKHFHQKWDKLRNVLFQNMSMTVEEHQSQCQKQSKRIEKLTKQRTDQDKLQEQLEKNHIEHFDQISKLKNRQSELNKELLLLQNKQNQEQTKIKNDAKTATEEAEAQHQIKMKDLSMQIRNLEAVLREMERKNEDEEKILKEKSDSDEMVLSNMVQKCVAELREKDDEIEEIKKKLEMERRERMKLQEHFDLVDRDKSIHDEEEMLLSNVKKMEEEAENTLRYGAVQMQKIFRGRKGRAMAAELKQKKLKAAKKKKKKGKRKNVK